MNARLLALAMTLAAAPAHAHGAHQTPAGTPGDPAAPARTINLTVNERPDGRMIFASSAVTAKLGEQVRFVVTNDGKARHEFRLDSTQGNAAHKAMMAQMPDMAHHDANAISLAPGATGTLLWRFTRPGAFEFACLLPGHYEAGMHGTVTVAK